MKDLTVIGFAIWLIGAGVKGIPSTGIMGSVTMIVGGVVVLVAAII